MIRPELRAADADLADFLAAQDGVVAARAAAPGALARLADLVRGPAEASVQALTERAQHDRSALPLDLVLEVAESNAQADADGWLLSEGGCVLYLTVPPDWGEQVARLTTAVVEGHLVLRFKEGAGDVGLFLHVLALDQRDGEEPFFTSATIIRPVDGLLRSV